MCVCVCVCFGDTQIVGCFRLRIGRPKTYPSEYAGLLGSTSIENIGTGLSSLTSGAPTLPTLHVPSNPASAMLAAQAAAAGIGITKRAIERKASR